MQSLQIFLLTVIIAGPFWVQVAQCSLGETSGNSYQVPVTGGNEGLSFSKTWQVLGPFRSGTREVVWGADPLECYGGFSNLFYDGNAMFSSALAANGTIKWRLVQADTSNGLSGKAKVTLRVSFPEVEWSSLQAVYGWSALQYQAWARGSLEVNQPHGQTVALFACGLLEFSVDGERHFGGDFYSYRRVPVILHLSPGKHTLDLRLIRDVRALGATNQPTIEVEVEAEERKRFLEFDQQSLLVSDLIHEKLGSTWASVNVQNNMLEWVEVLSVRSSDASQHVLSMERLLVAPYQARPLIFNITLGVPLESVFSVDVTYRIHREYGKTFKVQAFQVELARKSFSETHKVTFIHPARIVSYAILRPPPPSSICDTDNGSRTMPVIVGLHGAGLEAEGAQVRKMLDAAYRTCSWKLFPTGVTWWSGDDWHHWGAADVQAAVAAIPKWIQNVDWDGPDVAVDDWILVGHSNGGQGVWYFSTHHPDNIIAAAPVSGYSSIENYVPYNMWQESDPIISSILQKSRSSYKHELLLDNTVGIPILQQHGSDDDNVPVYHSRLMHELSKQAQWQSQFIELPGKGHWFEGVMTTPSLLKFYEENTASTHRLGIPLVFTITIPPSGDIGSVYGISVDQLKSPDSKGQIKIIRNPNTGVWYLRTHNIYRFHLSTSPRVHKPIALVLDDERHPFIVDPDQSEETWYLKDTLGQWKTSCETAWKGVHQRHGHQMGAMDAILRSHGAFTVFVCSSGTEHMALQISRNLFQYFAADSQIIEKCSTNAPPPNGTSDDEVGNAIILAVGDDLPPSENPAFPIGVRHNKLVLSRACSGSQLGPITGPEPTGERRYASEYAFEEGLGALFLRPLKNERLELVVWGADSKGLEQAARLVPTLTGVGQPDFLVLSHSCRCKGHGGLYAAGHFDKFWQISPSSYISDESRLSGSI